MSPVLFHVGENRLIEFGDTTEFVIGRSVDHNLCIPDSTISRKQCSIIKVPDGEWLINDTSSFRTTCVNGVVVPPNGLHIKCGDTITFGNLRSWQLQFYLCVDNMPPTTRCKRRRVGNDAAASSSQESIHSELSDCSLPKKSRKAENESLENKYKAVILERNNLAGTVEQLKREVKELEEAKEKADDIIVASHLDRQQLQRDYEDCCTEVDRLVKERQSLLSELQEDIKESEALEELANACGGPEAFAVPIELEGALILRTVEVEELQNELAEVRGRLETARENVRHLTAMRDKMYSDAIAIIEQEFLCCVCSDLMYEPVTLNCRHSLCGDCLKEWKKKKKECPSCRTKIKTEVRPIMIDSFLDRIAPLLGDEFLKKREEAKNDRAAPKTPPPPLNIAPVPGPSYTGGRGRRGSRRGGRSGHNRNPPSPLLPVGAPGYVSLNGAIIDLTGQPSSRSHHYQRRNDSDHTDGDSESLQEIITAAVLLSSDFDGEDLVNFDSEDEEDEVDEDEEVDDDWTGDENYDNRESFDGEAEDEEVDENWSGDENYDQAEDEEVNENWTDDENYDEAEDDNGESFDGEAEDDNGEDYDGEDDDDDYD